MCDRDWRDETWLAISGQDPVFTAFRIEDVDGSRTWVRYPQASFRVRSNSVRANQAHLGSTRDPVPQPAEWTGSDAEIRSMPNFTLPPNSGLRGLRRPLEGFCHEIRVSRRCLARHR